MEQKEARYTQEFKKQMVAMYKAGKPATELVKEYGMSKSTLHKWIGDYSRSGSFHAKDNRSVEENELIALRKKISSCEWRMTLCAFTARWAIPRLSHTGNRQIHLSDNFWY